MTFLRTRVSSSMAALALTSASLAVGAIVPAAAATGCDDIDGYTWSGIGQPWVVTHATAYEHFTHSSSTYTRTAETRVTITAGGTFSNDISGGIDIAIVKLGNKTGFSLSASGQATKSTSISVTDTMDQYGVYVFYDGHHKVSGDYVHTYCQDHTHLVSADGSVHSFDAARQGALYCPSNPPAGSLGYVVKQKYC
jgi:hypothetical protein